MQPLSFSYERQFCRICFQVHGYSWSLYSSREHQMVASHLGKNKLILAFLEENFCGVMVSC
jgi:hypothetical protein